MGNMGLKPEMRDGNTIRAYLDELVLLKTPIQLWLPQSDAQPFETTIAHISRDTFTTTQTPPLAVNQILNISFMVDSRRFIGPTQVVTTGVFKIPTTITQGERRERLRASFTQADGIEVFACEQVASPFLLGRVLTGRLLDLSLQGLRVTLDEVACLQEGDSALQRGDTFASLCISGLPFIPTIQCGAIVAHLRVPPAQPTAGFMLTGLLDLDRRNIERILARRFPTTFGQAFPKKNRKTDIADQSGTPMATKAAIKAPEVVVLPAAPPSTSRPPRPELSLVMRIKKATRKILVISAGTGGDGRTLADDLCDDEFKQVSQAKSYLEAQNLARSSSFDILLLDVKVGGHLGQMILEALQRNGLLLDIPVILIADKRDASIESVAEAIEAVYVHEKRAPYEDLLPAIYALLS